jgi:hypothetical protein
MRARPYLYAAAGATLLFLAVCPGVLKGDVLRPYDILYEHPPFAQHRPPGWSVPRNGAIWDGAMEQAAYDPLVREALRHRRLPAWNPYQGAGTPLMADGISAPFEVPKLVSLGVPLRQAPAVTLWLRLLIGTLGMVALLQIGLGVAAGAAIVGALTYATAAPVFGQIGIPHGAPAVWAPFVVLGAILATRRADSRGVLALALPTAALLVAGHPGTALPVLVLAGAAALWTSRKPRALLFALLGAGLGAGLAAPYLIPHVVFTNGSHQQVTRSAVGAAVFDVSRWRVWAWRPLTLVSPAAWTSPPVLLGWRRLGVDTFPESCLAVGAVGFTLMATALRTQWADHRVKAATVAGLVGLAATFRLPVVAWLLGLPAARILNPNQFVQVFVVAAAVLVAIGVEAVTREPAARVVFRRLVLFEVPGLAVAWLTLLVGWPSLIRFATRYADLSEGFQAHPVETLVAARGGFAFRMLIQLGALALLAFVALRVRRRVPAALAGIVLVEATALWFTYYPAFPPSEAPPVVPELAAIRQLAGTDRVAGLGEHDLAPNVGAMFRIRDANVYGNVPAAVGHYQPLIGYSDPSLNHLDGRAAQHRGALDALAVRVIVAGPASGELPGTVPASTGPVRISVNPTAVSRVRLVGEYTVEPSWRRTLARVGAGSFNAAREVVVDRVPIPAPAAGGGQARLVEDKAERLAVKTSADGPRLLVVADTVAAGWTARLDGRTAPILAANARVRAVALPAGDHTVTMTYSPPGWGAGLLVGALSLVVAVACLAVRPRRPHR